jgi:hypothetical protein
MGLYLMKAIKRGDPAAARKTVQTLLARGEADVIDGIRLQGAAACIALTEPAKHTEPAA